MLKPQETPEVFKTPNGDTMCLLDLKLNPIGCDDDEKVGQVLFKFSPNKGLTSESERASPRPDSPRKGEKAPNSPEPLGPPLGPGVGAIKHTQKRERATGQEVFLVAYIFSFDVSVFGCSRRSSRRRMSQS